MKKHHIKDDGQLPEYFVTALTLDYHERVEMQAAWQQHIDASISSTVKRAQQLYRRRYGRPLPLGL